MAFDLKDFELENAVFGGSNVVEDEDSTEHIASLSDEEAEKAFKPVEEEEKTETVEKKPVEKKVEEPESETEEEEGEEEGFDVKSFLENEWNLEVDDDFELSSPEDLKEVIEAVAAIRAEEAFASEEMMELNEFVKNGGDLRDYLRRLSEQKSFEDMDKTDKNDQRAIMEEYLRLKNPKKDATWIRNKIDKLEDSGLLEEEVYDAYDEVLDYHQEQAEYLKKQQEEAKRREYEAYQEQIQAVKETIMSVDKLSGFDIPKAKKQAFIDYLTKADKQGVTGYLRDYHSNPEVSLTSAWLMFNKFNIEHVKQTVKNEVTKETKKKLFNFEQGKKKTAKNPSTEVNYDDMVLKM